MEHNFTKFYHEMLSEKKNYQTFLQHITESPSRLGPDFSLPFGHWYDILKLTPKVIENIPLISSYTYDDKVITVHSQTIHPNVIEYYLITKMGDKLQIIGYTHGFVTNNEYIEELVWQNHLMIGMLRDFYLTHLIPKYNLVMSDQYHSEMGEKFWIKLTKDALLKGYKVFIRNIQTNQQYQVKNNEEVLRAFGDDVAFENIRLVIMKG